MKALAQELVLLTGQPATEVVEAAIETRLLGEQRRRRAANIADVVDRFPQLPELDSRPPQEIVNVDEHGLPS